ncbi:LysR family transcriptional regulator [Candidatus Methylacidiphilum fumarolicum]|uniref:Transcriptional regulator, LysR/CysB family n=2 Tax=Candidatus Methylacidiphilum fumarolicum TaxID=591154 RepID=I0K0Q8_METFB|nr:LysR family transcriptional regulator [Candidatus Methylacidiphilum fumarolicum]MBW6414779.1 LysR family transcriptional regulator [Candidatus Methylacidiphilum fumarolicum]TFE67497.1 LysR family transcriptional regulator [Candidatus Methylacidiphilum fumarolicum]TFE71403.1 LysR family transcriptional regulator [Candidatus Methylacidiphilum fumarolicum]TFE73084.1 LysR family transcriptional regulator [Candidatus Methylacidiphilum fumarolicum]TFE77067.1 LysR family transcriptional regulator 
MQIETLKAFRDLVESRSFSKAAQLNKISQSAVSQQIRSLEERFGVPLIERGSRKVQLTKEGEILYHASKEIVDIYLKIEAKISEIKASISGLIRVSAIYSVGLHELPYYLKKFLKLYPEVNVRVEYRHSRQVYQDIAEGHSDIGIVAYPSPRKLIKIEPFRKDRLVVICSPSHRFSNLKEVGLEEISKEGFIAFSSDMPTRRELDKLFRDRGLEFRPVMEFDNVETVKRAVEIDAGVAIVPMATITQELKNGTLRMLELSGPPCYRPIGLLYKSGRMLTPAMRKFIELLQKEEIPIEPVDVLKIKNGAPA